MRDCQKDFSHESSSRMLKKSASFVLAPLRPSTYGKEYASGLRSLRPRWTAFLNILQAVLQASGIAGVTIATRVEIGFSTPCCAPGKPARCRGCKSHTEKV